MKFEQTGGRHALRITRTVLFYEGEEATPGLLTRLTAPNTFNVNRPAQVTEEARSVLRVEITAIGGADCQGVVWSVSVRKELAGGFRTARNCIEPEGVAVWAAGGSHAIPTLASIR